MPVVLFALLAVEWLVKDGINALATPSMPRDIDGDSQFLTFAISRFGMASIVVGLTLYFIKWIKSDE